MNQWNFILAALDAVSLWLSEQEETQGTLPGFADFAQWVASRFCATRPKCAKELFALMQTVIPASDPSLYDEPTILGKINSKCNGRSYRVVAALAPRPGEKESGNLLLRDVVVSFVQNKNLPFSCNALICPFFTDTGATRTRGRAVVESFATTPSTRFEKLLFVAAVVQAQLSIDAQSKKRFKQPDGTPARPPVASLTKMTHRVSQRIGWVIQCIVRAWNRFASSLAFPDMESMLQPFLTLCPRWGQFEILPDRRAGFVAVTNGERTSVDTAPTTDSHASFPWVQNVPEEVDAALRQFGKDFLADITQAVSSSTLYIMNNRGEWPFMAKFDFSSSGLPPRFNKYRPQSRKAVSEFFPKNSDIGSLPSASSPQDSWHSSSRPVSTASSHAAMEREERRATTIPVGDLERNMVILERALVSSSRLYHCSFTDVCTENDCDETAPVLDGTVQLILTDPPFNVRRRRGARNSEYDKLGLEDMRQVVDLTAVLLRPGGHAVIFCTAQQFAVWFKLFTMHKSDVGSSGSTGSTFMVDAGPLIFTDHPSLHRTNPAHKSCALADAADLAVHLKKNGLPLKEEENMVNYKSFCYVRSSFPAYKNVIDHVMAPAPGERVFSAAPGGGKKALLLRPEQKPVALLMELVSRFSNPGDIVVDLFAGTFSTAIACFRVPQHRLFVGCESDEHCFKAARAHVLREFAAVVTEGRSDIALNAESMPAAEIVAAAAQRPAAACSYSRKWLVPDGLPPYQQVSDGIVRVLSSLWGEPDFYRSHRKKPLHKWSVKEQALLKQVDVLTLLLADTASSGLILAPSRIKHPNAGDGLYAARTFHRGEIVSYYFGSLVYHNLGARVGSKKLYGDGLLEVDAARFCKTAIQVRVEGRAFDCVRELMDGRKAVSIVPAPFCAGAKVNDFRYAINDEEKELYDAGKLPNPRSPNVEFIQEFISNTSSLIQVDRVALRAKRLINPGEELYVYYDQLDFAALAASESAL